MTISLTESQAINSMASLLYAYLPGTPHPYADPSVSFAGIASDLGLADFWRGGSKQPAVTMLLSLTLERKRDKFCPLLISIVQRGMIYRSGKSEPITRESIEELNGLIEKVNFKIPELWDPKFRNSLPSSSKQPSDNDAPEAKTLQQLAGELITIGQLSEQKRGLVFEKYLKAVFAAFGLDPRSSFRLVGEQIDGSFQLDGETYLVEAKWHNHPTPQSDLLVLQGRVEARSQWGRGLFVSYTGFSADGLDAFSRGRSTRLVGLSGQDLHFILGGKVRLDKAIRTKVRLAAETGRFYTSVYEMLGSEK